MALLKSKLAELVAGKYYIAYSAQSKKLSSNGDAGVIVKLLDVDGGRAHVEWFDLNAVRHVVKMARLDERKDCFLVPFDEAIKQVELKMTEAGGFERPAYSPRMHNLVEQGLTKVEYVSMLGVESLPEQVRSNYPHIIVKTEDNIPQPTILAIGQVLVTTNVKALVCSAEELEEKKRLERLEKIEKLKEGGVTLTVGKTLLGEKHTLDDLLPLRRKLMEDGARYLSSSTSYFSLVSKDLKVQYQDSGPCHASITRSSSSTEYILSTVQQWDTSKKTLKSGAGQMFINYLVNESPYKDIFLVKDVEDIIKNGYVLTTKAPSNAISSALTATRHMWEYPIRVEAFRLLSGKVSPNMAFFLCLGASGKLDYTKEEPVVSLRFNSKSTEHTAFNWEYLSDDGVLHYLLGAPANENEHLKGSYASPHRVWALWEPLCEEGRTPNFKNKLASKLFAVSFDTEKKSANPFEMPKSCVSQMIDYAVALANDYEGSI